MTKQTTDSQTVTIELTQDEIAQLIEGLANTARKSCAEAKTTRKAYNYADERARDKKSAANWRLTQRISRLRTF